MQVKQVMTTNVATCPPDANLAVLAKLMWDRDCGFVPVIDAAGKVAGVERFQVRRLPVITADGTLKGIVSMNDVVLASQQKDGPAATDIVSTLAAICAHRPAKAAAA